MGKLILNLVVFLLVAGVQAGFTQDKTYTFEFTGQPLTEVLERIASETDVDLIFDPALVGRASVYKRIRDKSVGDVLRSVLENTGLDYLILSSGTYVIVKSSRGEALRGSFAGRIVDAETGEPLPGAAVMIADASQQVGTASNLNGYFTLPDLLTGTYEITFSYIGYEPVRKVIEVKPEISSRETIRLQSGEVSFAPVIVSAHKPLLSTLDVSEFESSSMQEWMPKGGACAIQSLNLFSGVQYGVSFSDIHIQGGQRGEHRLFLDQIPVYNPYSFGHIFSAFSPHAIGQISVDKAGFDASGGSYMAGKVNLQHNLSGTNNRNFMVQADPLNTNVKARFGSQGQEPGSFQVMTAFRTSFWDLYRNSGLNGTISQWEMVDPLTYGILLSQDIGERQFASVENRSDVDYYDLHIASRYHIDEFRSLSATFYLGSNAIETDMLARDQLVADPYYMFSRDSYEWNNTVAGLRYDWLVSPRLDLGFQGGFSGNRLNHSYSMFDDGSIKDIAGDRDEAGIFRQLQSDIGQSAVQRDQNEIQHFLFQADANYSVSRSFKIGAGLQADHIRSRFDLTDFFYLPTLSDQESTLLSSYVNGKIALNRNTRLNVGSRFTAFAGQSRIFAEPRASIQYDQDQSRIGYWSVKLAGGMYRQFMNQFDITNVGPSTLVPYFTIWAHDSSFEQPLSYHTALSFLIEPGRHTSIRFETFAKIQPKSYITSYYNLMVGGDFDRVGLESFAEVVRSNSFGGSIRLHQSMLNSRLQVLAGYDLNITQIEMESQFGEWVPAPWNEPHRLQFRALARIGQQFSVVGKWQSILGRTWAYRQAYYDFMLTHNVHQVGTFDFTNPGSDRLQNYHQLDFSLVYTPQFSFGELEVRLDLLNVLDHRNTVDWNLQPDPNAKDSSRSLSIRDRLLPGFNPSASLTLRF